MNSTIAAQPTAPPLFPAAAHERNHTLDAARLLAALGVVWVHTVESPAFSELTVVGTFGVPFYVCVAMFVMRGQLTRYPEQSLPNYFFLRFKRLCIPFLFWSAVYLVAIAFRHRFLTHQSGDLLRASLILNGPAYQMWFLPFLMMVTIPAAAAFRFAAAHPGSGGKLALVSATIGTLWAYWPRPEWLNYLHPSEMFFLHAWKAMPAVFCGFAVSHFVSKIPKNENVLSSLAVVGFFLTWATIGNQVMYGYNRLDRTLSGLGWFLLAFAPIRGKLVQWLGKIGRHSFGIYLAHALFVEGMQYALHRLGFNVSPVIDLLVFSTAITASTILCLIASRHWLTAMLMGEPPKKQSKASVTAGQTYDRPLVAQVA